MGINQNRTFRYRQSCTSPLGGGHEVYQTYTVFPATAGVSTKLTTKATKFTRVSCMTSQGHTAEISRKLGTGAYWKTM